MHFALFVSSGFHLEGPFISVEKKGAHPEQYLRTFQSGGIEELLGTYGSLDNVAIVTLAPELASSNMVVKELCQRGITVSLGEHHLLKYRRQNIYRQTNLQSLLLANKPKCTVGGSLCTWRKTKQKQGEHAKSTQRDACLTPESYPGPPYCEMTMLSSTHFKNTNNLRSNFSKPLRFYQTCEKKNSKLSVEAHSIITAVFFSLVTAECFPNNCNI